MAQIQTVKLYNLQRGNLLLKLREGSILDTKIVNKSQELSTRGRQLMSRVVEKTGHSDRESRVQLRQHLRQLIASKVTGDVRPRLKETGPKGPIIMIAVHSQARHLRLRGARNPRPIVEGARP